ncbi:hypothetical protein B0T11DRAFT_300536 [Plectosphaerella cucumerina]|uniref:Uncharacterized protein n=1 Tax=Plectosphaerella cucumerina TaxID=40658 RepID=A0A8K0T9G0_9PEZI|nr:hypothetical protein B0T11DRAFT_300536 [Plectosphaerella cucumerina]
MIHHHLFALANAAVVVMATSCTGSNTTFPEQWRTSLPQVWDHMMARSDYEVGLNISATNNWALDQIMDGQGTINLCLRWGSTSSLTQENREQLESVYEQSIQQWLRWLPSWDGFPYEDVNVNVAAWAVNDTAQIEGPTDGFDVHTGFHDTDGLPTCNPGCSRELHQDGDYSGCPGGPDRRFHQYLVLSPLWGDYNMGAAASFGVDLSLFGWETIGSQGKPWPMPVHEFGHTFGFPDFLTDNTRPTNRTICNILWLPENAPKKFVMMPGSGGFDMAPELTDMEGWMLRHLWSRVSRLRGWQSDDMIWPAPLKCSAIEARDVKFTTDADDLCVLRLN